MSMCWWFNNTQIALAGRFEATVLLEINSKSSSLAQRCQAACPCLVWGLCLVMGADQLCCCGSTAKCLMGVSIHLLQLPEVLQCRCCCAIRGDGFNLTVKNYNCFFFLPHTETCMNYYFSQRAHVFCSKLVLSELLFCFWRKQILPAWDFAFSRFMYKHHLKKNTQNPFQGKQQKFTASQQCCSHISNGFCGSLCTSPILSLWFSESDRNLTIPRCMWIPESWILSYLTTFSMILLSRLPRLDRGAGLADSAVDVQKHLQAVASVVITFQGYKARVERKAERILYLFMYIFILKYICIMYFIGIPHVCFRVQTYTIHNVYTKLNTIIFCRYHLLTLEKKLVPAELALPESVLLLAGL